MTGYGRDYDYGLRGYRETTGARGRGGPGGYGADYPLPSHRVTARYNRDYVRPDPDRTPRNHTSYGGDVEGRIGDVRAGYRPYLTVGGSRTMRGGSLPMGWERGSRYGRDYRGPYR